MISLCANAFSDDISAIKIKSLDTISAVQNNDILTTKSSESITQLFQRNDGLFINNRKSDNSLDNGLHNFLLGVSNQFNELLAYIYNQSFLHNKSKVLFSVNLSEIQPNAP